MKKRILDIGTGLMGDLAEYHAFRSDTSLLDYDIILVDLEVLSSEYTRHSHYSYKGRVALTPEAGRLFKEDLARRKGEMIDVLRLGRTVVLLVPSPTACYLSFKRRGGERMYGSVDWQRAIPLFPGPLVRASGSSLESTGAEPFRAFCESILTEDAFTYRAYFDGVSQGKPMLFIKDTGSVVGAYNDSLGGYAIFLPALREPPGSSENTLEQVFTEALTALVDQLQRGTECELPGWSETYLLPGESEQAERVCEAEQQLVQAKAHVVTEKGSLESLRRFKVLLAGHGDALKDVVKQAFEALGFDVQEGEPGRDDLIMAHDVGRFVVEVKGLTKSAGEKDAMQLEKWRIQYYEREGITPKGILVVNAYREVPLAERTEPAFPNQMLPLCEGRGHCLISGLQLLGAYLDCHRNPHKKDEIAKRLNDAVGVFDGYSDWSEFLDVLSEGASGES